MRAGRASERGGSALSEVFLAHTAVVRSQEALLYLTVKSTVRSDGRSLPTGDACANDAFDQREASGRNAAQQTTVV